MLLALAAAPRPANAQRAVEPVARLDVDEGSECASRASVVARVHARAPAVRFLDEGTALGIRVRFVTLAPGRIEGTLVLSPEGAGPATRRLVARGCAEAIDAVALIIAVTLGQGSPAGAEGRSSDGTEASGVGGGGGTSTVRPPTAGAAARGDDGPTKAAPAAGAPPAGATAGAPERTSEPGEGRSSGGAALTLDAELVAQAFVGPAPGIMPAAGAFVLAALERDTVLSPAVALGITHGWKAGVVEQGGTAVFMLDAATLELCPVRVLLPLVVVRPCGAALVGRLAAVGRKTLAAPGLSARPFGVVGGSVLFAGDFGWIVEPSLRAFAGANLVRDSFTFTPVVFHRVPPVTAALSIGLSVRLR